MASPAIQRQIENYKSRVLRRYGQEIREWKTNLGSVHIHQNGVIKISKKDYSCLRTVDDPVREVKWYRIVSKDEHPTMLQSKEAFPLGVSYVSVTPRATQDTLLVYTSSHLWRPDVAKKMFLNLLQGVAVLHNGYRVAHLDLKLENIFLDEDDQIIIGDFGLALPVKNAQRDEARRSSLHGLEQQLERAGAHAADIESRIADFNKKFDGIYEQYDQQHKTITKILHASPRDAEDLINRLKGLKVPLAWVFRQSYQNSGYVMTNVRSIDGYTDPNDPQMSGEELVNSFLTHLRRKFPDETDQKRAISRCSARLRADLDPELYRLACKPDYVAPPAATDEPRGTAKYMCPSLAAGTPTDPFAADVYSLGVILFCMATGFSPYTFDPDENPLGYRAYAELKCGGVGHLLRCYERSHAVTPECLALLERMMSFNPADRPTIDECIELFKSVEILPRG